MEKMLAGKVALVTGATSGMGKSVAETFAREGARVVIGGRNASRGEAIAQAINDEGNEARFYGSLDITNKASIKSTVDAIIADYGRIDILAAFAGGSFDEAEGLSEEEKYKKTVDVNMTGTYNTVFEVVPYMQEQKSGNIIICSSNGAFNPTTTPYAYHMSKAACESLTINLAFSLAPLGIRANCIKPGPIITGFWDELLPPGPERDMLFDGISTTEVPLQRMGTGDDIAGPALFFASDLSAYVTGLCMYVGGGMGYCYSQKQSFIAGMVAASEAAKKEAAESE